MGYKTLVVHNPIAGENKHIRLSKEIEKHFPSGLDYDYTETKYPKHALELAKEAVNLGYNRIIAAGGDGTINEVASQLIHTETELGIIPMGSGNGLARHLAIPLNIAEALKVAASGRRKAIDVGSANGIKFFCAAGVGFDAEVSHKFAQSKIRGLKTYIWIGAKCYLKYHSKQYSMRIDDNQNDVKAFLISVANAAQFGNGAFIAPGASICDGKLNIAIINPFNIWEGVWLFRRLFNKKIERCRPYRAFVGEKITFKLNQPMHYHCDGEVFEANGSLEFSLIPQALNVIVPVKK